MSEGSVKTICLLAKAWHLVSFTEILCVSCAGKSQKIENLITGVIYVLNIGLQRGTGRNRNLDSTALRIITGSTRDSTNL